MVLSYVALWFYYGAFRVQACLTLCPHVLSVLFSIVIISPGEEGTGLCASRAFVCLFCTRQFLSLFSSSWCQGLIAAWFLTVTCSCCPYLYFGSAIMLVTYFVNFR